MAVRSLPVLYMTDLSPPVRSVLLTARALGVTLKKQKLNLEAKDNCRHAYIEKNPLGTVPLLEDNDCVISDSHAISGYLVNKYGKDDALYPREPRKRAMVDQRLHFESGIVYPVFRNIVIKGVRRHCTFAPLVGGVAYRRYKAYPLIFGNRQSINRDGIDQVNKMYKSLDFILERNRTKWLAGDDMTIADLCNVSTISTLEIFTPSTAKYHHLDIWLNRCKSEIPGYRETNQRGLDRLVKMMKAKLAS